MTDQDAAEIQRLHDLIEDETAAIKAAARTCEWYAYGVHLCERAWLEMRLRDVWQRDTERFSVWQEYMNSDLDAARSAMERMRAGAAST